MIQTVVKRDGRIVGFNREKIAAAIRKAMLTTENGEDDILVYKIVDRIEYKGRPVLPTSDKKTYILLNKPRGYVTTLSDEKNRPTATAAYDRIWRKEPPKVLTAAELREQERLAVSETTRGTVARLIAAGRGATSATLRDMSPTPIPLAPVEQAAAQLRALGADWRWPIWAGTIGPTGKRGAIVEPWALAETIRANLAAIPTHISLNPLTGQEGLTKDGTPSYDCAATVAAFPFALLEFDELSLADQCALFAELIRRKPGRVVSLCYSGGKSIHAVILIREAHDRRLKTLPPSRELRETRNDLDERQWADEMAALRRVFASSDNPAERIDLAPTMNPAIHTRLAGAFRPDKNKRQTLLYLDAELARRELEIF